MIAAALPSVPRFNAWDYWAPIIACVPQEDFVRHQFAARRFASPEAAAVYQYCVFTGRDGIEFVMLSRHLDRAPFRRLAGGIILVPCAETAGHQPYSRPPPWFLYDGWLPIENSAEETIMRGLEVVEETMSTLAYAHCVSARWIVKYSEAVGELGPNPTREISDSDFDQVSKLTDGMSRLPVVVRDALVRTIHWLQHAEQSKYATDRFLARYYAFEGLCLALWQNAADVELPIPGDNLRESKTQRKRRQDAEIKLILEQFLTADPRKAVSDAYFNVISTAWEAAVTLSMLGDADLLTTHDAQRKAPGPLTQSVGAAR